LIQGKSFRDARIMLSSACQLVKDILLDQDPRALDCVLESFLYMKQHHLDEVVDIIRSYISAMAAEIFASNPSHPWARIWSLLGSIDSEHLLGAIDQSWKRATRAFDQNLGRFHEASLGCYLEYSAYFLHLLASVLSDLILNEEVGLRHGL
jgi:hypothetical protein